MNRIISNTFEARKNRSKQEEFKRLSDDQGRARTRLDDSKAKEKRLEVVHFLAKRMFHTRQIEQLQKEIQAIEGSLEMKESQEAVQVAKEDLRKQWNMVFLLWQQII